MPMASVKSRKGIFEYVLGGETETKLLEIRVFEDPTKRSVYEAQTTIAKKQGISNCPHCAIGHDANKDKIWSLADMDADHVTAWSKGGATDQKIVRCCARLIIGQKEIGKLLLELERVLIIT